jgi:hypothetical protein
MHAPRNTNRCRKNLPSDRTIVAVRNAIESANERPSEMQTKLRSLGNKPSCENAEPSVIVLEMEPAAIPFCKCQLKQDYRENVRTAGFEKN